VNFARSAGPSGGRVNLRNRKHSLREKVHQTKLRTEQR
jgi:hypothetical protein